MKLKSDRMKQSMPRKLALIGLKKLIFPSHMHLLDPCPQACDKFGQSSKGRIVLVDNYIDICRYSLTTKGVLTRFSK